MRRREFLKTTALSGVALSGGAKMAQANESNDVRGSSSNPSRLPRRPYGETGIELSVIGFG